MCSILFTRTENYIHTVQYMYGMVQRTCGNLIYNKSEHHSDHLGQTLTNI